MVEMDFIMTDYGVTATYITVTQSLNTRGDSTDSTSNSSVQVIFQPITAEDELVKAGILNIGDARIFFLPDATVNLGDRITYRSITYTILDVITPEIGSEQQFKETRCKRYIDQ